MCVRERMREGKKNKETDLVQGGRPYCSSGWRRGGHP